MPVRRLVVASLIVVGGFASAVSAQTPLAVGAASGDLTVNGQTVAMKYSYSYMQTPKDGGKSDLVLLVSDQPVPASSVRDEDALVALSRDGKFSGVRVIVGPGGKDKSGMPFHKSLKVIVSTGLFVHSDITDYDGKTVAGEIESGKAELAKQTWEYDVKFNAVVLPLK